MVKAHHHTPGISVIPLTKSSPGESCALCAFVPTFQPRMCCKRSCLHLKPGSSPRHFSRHATVWPWPGMCGSTYSDEQLLGEVILALRQHISCAEQRWRTSAVLAQPLWETLMFKSL